MTEARAATLAEGRDAFTARLLASSQARPPGLLARDAFAAYSDGETTLRPYARLLGLDVEELRRQLETEEGGPV